MPTQRPPTEPVRSSCKPPPVVIGQAHTARTELPSEEPILFDQIGQRVSLLAIESADDDLTRGNIRAEAAKNHRSADRNVGRPP